MGKVLDEDLVYEILSVVAEIPAGYVASYGQIARLIGREKNSRLVGAVLSEADRYGDYPCHRVVNQRDGSHPTSPTSGRCWQRKESPSEATAAST